MMFSIKTKRRADPTVRPRVKFAITGNPRTGSSHLVYLLDSHPEIGCWDHELFDVNEDYDRSSYTDPAAFLAERVFRLPVPVVGFKFMWDALVRIAGSWNVIADAGIRLVHTYRANKVDSYISFRLALMNKAFTCWDGAYVSHRFTATYAECVEWFETMECQDAALAERATTLGIPRIAIEYQELCATQERVLEFLGAAPHPLTSRLQKQRTHRQSEIISNYGTLKDEFADTRWAHFFED